ncbi:MAG: hypothetical protein V4677_04700 [Bacteroidota bacterium]
MKYLLLFSTVILLFSSCIQTRTFSTHNQKLDEFNKPDYIGTFASIYYVDANKKVNIEPLQTLTSIYKNDSIIRKRVKKTNFTNQKFDTLTSKRINSAIFSILNYTKSNEKIKGYTAPDVFDEIGKTTTSNFNLYFISVGFTKDTNLAKEEAILKGETIALNLLSGFAFGMSGVLIVNEISKNGADAKAKYVMSDSSIDFKGAFDGKQGLKGFVVVYDKSKKEICYIREQFFTSDQSPLNLNSVRKQIKNAFKETYF